MISGAIEGHGRGIPGRVEPLAALVRQGRRRMRRGRDFGAGLGHAGLTEISIQIAPDLMAERPPRWSLERHRDAVGEMFGLLDGLPHGLGIIDDAPDLMDTL